MKKFNQFQTLSPIYKQIIMNESSASFIKDETFIKNEKMLNESISLLRLPWAIAAALFARIPPSFWGTIWAYGGAGGFPTDVEDLVIDPALQVIEPYLDPDTLEGLNRGLKLLQQAEEGWGNPGNDGPNDPFGRGRDDPNYGVGNPWPGGGYWPFVPTDPPPPAGWYPIVPDPSVWQPGGPQYRFVPSPAYHPTRNPFADPRYDDVIWKDPPGAWYDPSTGGYFNPFTNDWVPLHILGQYYQKPTLYYIERMRQIDPLLYDTQVDLPNLRPYPPGGIIRSPLSDKEKFYVPPRNNQIPPIYNPIDPGGENSSGGGSYGG